MTADSSLAYLTLEEIRAQLDVPIDQIRAFADRSEVRVHCGAVPNPKTRGVMWPPEAVPILAHLLAMRHAGKLEPKNVRAYLEDLEVGQIGPSYPPTAGAMIGQSSPLTGSALIGPLPRSADVATAQALDRAGEALNSVGETIAGLLERLAESGSALERIASAQETLADAHNCIFTAAEAAEFLRCSTRRLRRSVPPSFRLGSSQAGDRWRRRDLLNLKG